MALRRVHAGRSRIVSDPAARAPTGTSFASRCNGPDGHSPQCGYDSFGDVALTQPNRNVDPIPGLVCTEAATSLGNAEFSSATASVDDSSASFVAPNGAGDDALPNTNPFDGPVDQDVFVVDSHGTALDLAPGEYLTGSPDGMWVQVRGSDGSPTGVRLHGRTNRPHTLIREHRFRTYMCLALRTRMAPLGSHGVGTNDRRDLG